MPIQSCFSGELKLRECEEASGLIDELDKVIAGLEIHNFQHSSANGITTLQFLVEGYTSSMHDSDVQEAIERLGAYCVTPGRVTTVDSVGEEFTLYIGSREQQRAAEREDRVQQVMELAADLEPEDLENIVNHCRGCWNGGRAGQKTSDDG